MHFIGPTSDHTSGKGKYIFIEASSPRKVNDTAVIASPTVNSDGDYCLTFWYHMYGKSKYSSIYFLLVDW